MENFYFVITNSTKFYFAWDTSPLEPIFTDRLSTALFFNSRSKAQEFLDAWEHSQLALNIRTSLNQCVILAVNKPVGCVELVGFSGWYRASDYK